jgi:hypothetical protein
MTNQTVRCSLALPTTRDVALGEHDHRWNVKSTDAGRQLVRWSASVGILAIAYGGGWPRLTRGDSTTMMARAAQKSQSTRAQSKADRHRRGDAGQGDHVDSHFLQDDRV